MINRCIVKSIIKQEYSLSKARKKLMFKFWSVANSLFRTIRVFCAINFIRNSWSVEKIFMITCVIAIINAENWIKQKISQNNDNKGIKEDARSSKFESEIWVISYHSCDWDALINYCKDIIKTPEKHVLAFWLCTRMISQSLFISYSGISLADHSYRFQLNNGSTAIKHFSIYHIIYTLWIVTILFLQSVLNFVLNHLCLDKNKNLCH